MEVDIKDSKGFVEIKINDTKIENVTSYSVSSDEDFAIVTLVLAVPKGNFNLKFDY